ncbi:uncharacterized protein K02A2.6-like [Sinocyclocheilus anshuiensis]|uniref:uncharacterized protein K02A2.6-like n=1 Tax=Sinocyclocheilus anshuiensis TaxID=1608454 RepID=UPI0007B979C3|nr:PREDICTED: uncharacterized protein K02A2.6-like [Sinocyclocheilus anshuiensis]
MRSKVDAEINRLLNENIITPVKYSEWAAPVVPILKPDGSIRLCGDYKLTINQASPLEQYPIPRVEDLFTTLSGGSSFSKLDMSHAYQQIVMDENSKQYLTVNTHKGMFTYNRLPFGVASAPAIFQRTIEGLLQGLTHVAVYLDDILITGVTDEEHLQTLDAVLTRLQGAGLRLKRDKCEFLQKEVRYLGHLVDAQGLHPLKDKVQALTEAPCPTNVTELKAYLGLLNYYNKFLPNVSSILAPLHMLLRKDTKWTWGESQTKAFKKSKELLQSTDVLVHYSSEKDLILSCDASSYGVGAVLSHRMEDNTEKPLGFVSRTLTPAERRYSQLDKEALAIIFGVKKFHKYLYGRKFTICTDHKPLIFLFAEKKPIPQMGSPRVQRWALLMSAYEYTMVYKSKDSHANADALSRLPLLEVEQNQSNKSSQVLMLDMLEFEPISATQLKSWTNKDVLLSQVRNYVLRGWPNQVDPQYNPYHKRKLELSVRDGCVLWGARVIVPSQGRAMLLKLLHQSHTGMAKMKGLARSYFWWPGMDKEVEKESQLCEECMKHRKMPPVAPLHPWEWPETPWSRIHVDYAGPFLGKMFLVIVDAHSKWMDIYPMNSSTSQATIEKLRQSFSIFGITQILVSDDGFCFTSTEFEKFMKNNGIRHVRSAPFHPSSNGLAERAVQTFKGGLRKVKGDTLETRLSRFLFNYRITPHATTGVSPAEMLMARKLRSTFDLLLPDIKAKVQQKQQKQRESHDKNAKLRVFTTGDDVLVRNYSYGPKWIPAVIVNSSGPVSYTVAVGSGQILKRHVDQIRIRHTETFQDSTQVTMPSDGSSQLPEIPCFTETETVPEVDIPSQDTTTVVAKEKLHSPDKLETPAVPRLRRSSRERRPPIRLQDYVQ